MLLNNKSKLCYRIELDLTFDDDSNKKATINVDDTIHISFRKNGVKLVRQGKVRNIYPSRITESKLYGTNKLSAIIELDCSKDYQKELHKIDIDDILDFLPLEVDEEDPEIIG
ncbi:MAG: hypothetical protein PHC62_00040 [Candidatus Izemoplasmatales bacterium]|nr:hypothetical protein [Candidatus Izemoplasmatales bacterium]